MLELLAFAMPPVTKTTRAPLALPAGYQPLELGAGEGYSQEEGAALALAAALAVAAALAHVAAPAPLEAEVDQIGQMIEREPERIAEILRAWLEAGPSDR